MKTTETISSASSLLTTEAAASYLNLRNKRTLDNWRSLGCGPQFVKVGRSVRYRQSDLVAWVDSNTMQVTSKSA